MRDVYDPVQVFACTGLLRRMLGGMLRRKPHEHPRRAYVLITPGWPGG